MKTSQIICLILAAALAVVSWLYVRSASGAGETATEETAGVSNAAYDCIMTRTSCRSFTDYRPTEQQIDSLLRAGMASPTARNQQAWQFVVITDRDILDSIAASGYMSMLREAPLAIVPCGDMTIAAEKAKDFWVQDLSAVSENILLAAHSMGLGAVWCGVYPVEERTRRLSEILELPDNVVPLSCIPVGMPKGKLTPKDKFDEDKIHYNGY